MTKRIEKKAEKSLEAAKSLATVENITLAAKDVLGRFAVMLSDEKLPPEQLAQVFLALRDIEKVLEDKNSGLTTIAKKRVIAYLKAHGRVTTEKGSMVAEVGGLTLSMHPTRTGYDAKKVEALLRAKGKDPAAFMTTVIKYEMPPENSVEEAKLKKLLGDELESCRYEESWTVATPK